MSQTNEFTVNLHETVEFARNTKLTFLGHSHKMVQAGGPSSPLIVIVEYDVDGKKERHEYHTYPGTQNVREYDWTWMDHSFYIKDHAYDKYMVLLVRRIPKTE